MRNSFATREALMLPVCRNSCLHGFPPTSLKRCDNDGTQVVVISIANIWAVQEYPDLGMPCYVGRLVGVIPNTLFKSNGWC